MKCHWPRAKNSKFKIHKSKFLGTRVVIHAEKPDSVKLLQPCYERY
jgi:hypothetical protein